ncbi:MAG: type II toxin-antitoxin system ParD family antitoxin [Limisphaerales bacterium]
MNVSLTPELEEFIAGKVATGLYQTASEVVREGLRLLEERDQLKLGFVVSSAEDLQQKLQEGLRSLERGEFSTSTAEDIIAAGRAQLAGRKAHG